MPSTSEWPQHQQGSSTRPPLVVVFSVVPDLFNEVAKALAGRSENVVQVVQVRVGEEADADNQRILADAEFVLSEHSSISTRLHLFPKLRWLHSAYAGVEKIFRESNRRDFVLTRFVGYMNEHMCEYVLGCILSIERHLPFYAQQQMSSTWTRHSDGGRARRLSQLTVGIMGASGEIGGYVARTMLSLGIRVHGFSRRRQLSHQTREASSPSSSSVAAAAATTSREDHNGTNQSSASQANDSTTAQHHVHSGSYNHTGASAYQHFSVLNDFLSSGLDYLVNVLPSTAETRGMLSGEVLRACVRKGNGAPSSPCCSDTVFINIGRGDIIDERSILAALDAGWIAGAVLDVLPVEPLPSSSPLWKSSKATITPHIAAISDAKDVAESLVKQLDLLSRGLKLEQLPHQVDWTRGY